MSELSVAVVQTAKDQDGSQYGSIDSKRQTTTTTTTATSSGDLPPKPAVRQRTLTRQNNSNNIDQIKQQTTKDLCDDGQGQGKRKSSSSSLTTTPRDELNRELQAELGRKLSLARSRLEQSEQLECQVKSGTNYHHDSSPVANSNKNITTDLSLSLSQHNTEKKPPLHHANNSSCIKLGDDNDHYNQLSSPNAGDSGGGGGDKSAQIHHPSTRAYPKKVFFIIANEFCERFSFYGLRTVLVMYLTGVLNFSETNSTITFHLFTMLCYVTPIMGAILGDSILGKFKTIFYLSIVYFIGEFILMLSSVFWNYGQVSTLSTFIGLILIGFGTGGIKPCVCALGGDQFMEHEEKWRQSFFSLFYAAINMGSLITVFVTPLLRTEFQCVGRQDCFPYAFGLPCSLMLLAIVVFLLAKNKYYLAPIPEENVLVSFCTCIWVATKRKFTGRRPKFVLDDNLAIVKHIGEQCSTSSSSSSVSSSSSSGSCNDETYVSSTATKTSSTYLAPGKGKGKGKLSKKTIAQDVNSERRSHWLYLAADRFDSKSIEAFRSVLGILLLFIPATVYWCLFDQQGSLWTLQATRMDGHIFGEKFVLQPDQMGVANPLIVLAIIPIFEVFIYPILGKCNLMKKPLQRMTMGGLVASLAFLSSAAIEMRIQQFQPPNEPATGLANLILVNGLRECSIINPTISHIPMPDVVYQTPQMMMSSSNQSSSSSSDTSTINDGNKESIVSSQVKSNQLIRLNSLEALAAQSVNVRSANSTTLNNYQLKFKLSDSVEQMKSNKSFGCPIADSTNIHSTAAAGGGAPGLEHEFDFAPVPDQATRLLYLELGNGKLTYKIFNESLELPPSNKARVRLLYEFFGSSSQAERRQFMLASNSISGGDIIATAKNKTFSGEKTMNRPKTSFNNFLRDGQVLLSDYLDVEVSTSGSLFTLESSDGKFIWTNAGEIRAGNSIAANSILLEPGTRNLLIIHQSDANNVWLKHQVLQDNKYRINMLYQLIPYTLISIAEVMFSITGLEFSYSMAPASMKSVLMAIWCLTIAFGNLLTVFVESLHMFTNIAHEFMFYSGLMAIDMCIFAIMGYNFRPNKYHGN